MEEDYFENFVGIYDKHFSRQYRFWRHHVQQLIDRHLHCGEIHNGFACMTANTAATDTSRHLPVNTAALNW
jgi:hypothetical protein